jgi:hypothetical protein
MRKSARKKSQTDRADDVELIPDAWPKFEALIKSAAKMGHKPHTANAPTASRATSKKRVHSV